MKVIGILIVIVLGLLFLQLIDKRLNPIEKAGFAFPMGISVVSFLILFFDIAHIRVTLTSLLAGLILIGLASSLYLGYTQKKPLFIFHPKHFRNIEANISINLSWLFFFGLTMFVIYGITVKAFFWPVTAHDAIAGYDFIAKTIVAEGKLDTSIFDSVNKIYANRHAYPPLVPSAFAYSYFVGFATPKIISSLYFISALVGFYGLLTRYVSHLNAIVFTFIFATVPDLLAMSAFALTNIASMLYSAFGLIYLFVWYERKDDVNFIFGTVLLMLGIWTRSEGIVFAAAGGVFFIVDYMSTKNWKRILMYLVGTSSLFLIWQLYLKYGLNITVAQPVIYDLFWNGDKLIAIVSRVVEILFDPNYGITVYLFLIILTIHFILTVIKNDLITFLEDKTILLGVTLIAFSFYLLIFYQLDIYENGELVGTWIINGFKRGFFNYLPLLLFYTSTNQSMQSFFDKLTYFPASKNKGH